MVKHYESKVSTFFSLGAICLIGLFLEYVFLLCEQLIYDKNYYQFTITESITHWVLICVVWGIIGLVLFYIAARVFGFDFSKKKNTPNTKGWLTGSMLIPLAVAFKIAVWSGFKINLDFHNSGWFQFIFQYIYYFFEMFLVLTAIVFTQEACERISKIQKVPFGGIILAVTWGLSHIITQGSLIVGLSYVVLALMFGIAYIAMNKNFYLSYVLITMLFLI